MEQILDKLDPDYHLEEFWISFKDSMLNYCKITKISFNFENHIILYSHNLNILKTNKKYNEIEKNISEFIMEYAILLVKTNKNCNSHDTILLTNIKRWSKISNNFNDKYNNILIIFMINIALKEDNINNIDIIKCYNDNNYNIVIKYCFDFNKCKIFNLLVKIKEYNIYDNIRILYPDLDFVNGTKFNKLYQNYKK